MSKFDQAKKLYELQKKARVIQKELKDTEIEAASNDGAVAVVFNGEQHITDVRIDESMLSPENKGELEKAIKNVVGQAIARSQSLAAEKMKAIAGDLNLPGLG